MGETLRFIERRFQFTPHAALALIRSSAAPRSGGASIDYLMCGSWNGGESGNDPFPPMDPMRSPGQCAAAHSLGPGLLVFPGAG